MIRFSIKQVLIVTTAALAAVLPLGAAGQNVPVVDTLQVQGLSSLEEGRLMFFNLNRAVHSTRARAMGGAGIGMLGGIEMYSLNPAAVLGATRPELMSQGTLLNGSSTVNSSPNRVFTGTGDDDYLDVSGYRVSSSLEFNYASLSFGLPVVLLGGRGSLGLSYQRQRYDPQRNEVRFDATGRAAGDQSAQVGVSNKPNGGYDAFTGTIARELLSFLSVGANFNLMRGSIEHNTDSGISAEFPVAQGSSSFKQDYESFNIDFGAQLELGKLRLGAIAYLGHDLEYKDTEMLSYPFPDLEESTPTTVRFERDIPGHTQSVPTTLGFGGSYMWKRFTFTGDYVMTPWSESEITRESLSATPFFSVPEDSTKFNYVLSSDGTEQTFSAKLDDSNSLRLGLQFMAHDSGHIKVPLWIGYRTERLTMPDIVIPDQFRNFDQLILDYWRYNVAGYTPPEGVDPAQIEADLIAALESNQFLFNRPGSEATTITFGSGVTIGQVTFEAAVDYTSWEATRFFFEPFDARLQRFADYTDESLSSIAVTLAAKMTF